MRPFGHISRRTTRGPARSSISTPVSAGRALAHDARDDLPADTLQPLLDVAYKDEALKVPLAR